MRLKPEVLTVAVDVDICSSYRQNIWTELVSILNSMFLFTSDETNISSSRRSSYWFVNSSIENENKSSVSKLGVSVQWVRLDSMCCFQKYLKWKTTVTFLFHWFCSPQRKTREKKAFFSAAISYRWSVSEPKKKKKNYDSAKKQAREMQRNLRWRIGICT